GVVVEETLLHLGAEPERLDLGDHPLPPEERVVGGEADLVLAEGPEEVHERRREMPGDMRRGVDPDVAVLPGDRDHLLGPRPADVPADDAQLREVERHLVDVGWTARLRREEGAGVADLRLERHVELGRLGVERVVGAVGRRLPPEERLDAERDEAAVADVVLELADGAHDVRRARVVLAEDAAGVRALGPGHGLVVAGHERRPAAVAVHRLDHARPVRPVVKDVEHAVVPEDVLAPGVRPGGWRRDVLRPDVGDHAAGSPSTRWAMMLRCTSEVPALSPSSSQLATAFSGPPALPPATVASSSRSIGM